MDGHGNVFAPATCRGRDQEHAALRALVTKSRVVFVYGPAGVGKTSLVLDVCNEAARTGVLPPVVHISVPGAITAREAVERTAKAIGQRPPEARVDDALSVLLSSAPHTVVWDDIDEKAVGITESVRRFASQGGAARIVLVSRRFVTSTEATLRAPVYEVPPLGRDAALALVRALEEERGRTLADDLVEATAGNPLLLRIALADNALPRVAKNATDALRRAVEERLADEASCTLLELLAAAAAPLDEIELTKVVGKGARAAVDDLRKHLLVVREGTRLVLAAPVLSLAQEILGEPEAETWRALATLGQHALATSGHDDTALLVTARAQLALGQAEQALRLLREQTVARAAAPPAALERVLREVASRAPAHAPTALRLLARELLRAGDYDSARRALDELAPSKTRDDAERVALLRAETYIRAGEPDAAQRAIDVLESVHSAGVVLTQAQLAILRGEIGPARRVLETLETSNIPQLEARRAVEMAASHLYEEEYALTTTWTSRARAAQKSAGIPVERIVTILDVFARLGLGEVDRAEEVLARDTSGRPDGPLDIAALVRRGELARALEVGDGAISALDRRADRLYRSVLARDLARAAIGTGDLARADKMVRLAEVAGNDPGLAALGPICDAERARLAEAQGDHALARRSIEHAFQRIPASPFVVIDREIMNGRLPVAREDWPPVARAYATLRSAELLLDTGELAAALENAELAERYYATARLWHETARAGLARAEALARLAAPVERIHEALAACEELARSYGYVPIRVGALIVRASLAEAAGDLPVAARALETALELSTYTLSGTLVRAAARFGVSSAAPPSSRAGSVGGLTQDAVRVQRLGLEGPAEVTWRIGQRTYLRAREAGPPEPVSCIVDVAARKVETHPPGQDVELPEQRLALLSVLADAGADGVSLEEIFAQVWGGEFHPLRHRNAVYVALARLKDSLKPLRDLKITHDGDRYRLVGAVAVRRVTS